MITSFILIVTVFMSAQVNAPGGTKQPTVDHSKSREVVFVRQLDPKRAIYVFRSSVKKNPELNRYLGKIVAEDRSSVTSLAFELTGPEEEKLTLGSFVFPEETTPTSRHSPEVLDVDVRDGELVFALWWNPVLFVHRFNLEKRSADYCGIDPAHWTMQAAVLPKMDGSVSLKLDRRADGLWTARITHRMGDSVRISRYTQDPGKWEFSWIGSDQEPKP